MIKKYLRISCLVFCITLFLLSGCGEATIPEETENEASLSIHLKDSIPNAYVGVAYDLDRIIIMEDDVDYSYKASYIDPETGDKKKLTVKSGKFSPKVDAEINVEITAECGLETAVTEIVIPMGITADALDMLLASDGAAGEADSGVNKIVTKNAEYIKGDNSTSSLQISFENPVSSNDGTSLLELSHYSLNAYYSSRVWENAAVTFWVYNPMEQEVIFKLTSYNPENDKSLFWSSGDNTQTQVAAAGQWTIISFSLFDMGIEQVLFNAPDNSREDFLTLQARYAGAGECSIYIDGIDVVPADKIEELSTGYFESPVPSGDYTDILSSYRVYTNDTDVTLSFSKNGNGSSDSVCIGADEAVGYPTFHVDFPEMTDISGFDYMKFDVYAEKCYPWVSVAVRYLDENGEEQKYGTSFDFYRETWRTLYLNLDYLLGADLTRVVGFSFSINVSSHYVENAFNCVYFDNVCLYDYPVAEPEISPATIEDHDLISGPMYAYNIKPGTSGICKVAADEEGKVKSNSTLLFWTNTACGYPNVYASFMFEEEQDWSDYSVFSFDTHQYNAHYWMCFTLILLDEDGNQTTARMVHDTVLTNWMTNSHPLEWFKTEDGSKPDLSRVIGLNISVDMAVNVTDEVGYIFFDNISVS